MKFQMNFKGMFLLIAIVLLASLTLAGNITKPYTFAPDTPASSAQVNANFDVVYDGVNKVLPTGIIVMWSGTLDKIPSGWVLCDGGTYTASDGSTATTPDLRERFIYGTKAGENPGATGGVVEHQHNVGIYKNSNANGNGMPIDWGWPYWEDASPSGQERYYQYYNAPGSNKRMLTGKGSSLPPYFKLAFILKK